MSDLSVEEEKLLHLFAKGDWEEILRGFDKNKFLPWIWPSLENLNFIEKCLRDLRANTLISIGCGYGLLEWLIHKATGIHVIGIEINEAWWKSSYSRGTFIPVVFADNSTSGQLEMNTETSVLLFCYFNNLTAFLNYVDNYCGKCLIVIGPAKGRNIFTIPEPFQLPLEIAENWQLNDSQEITSSKDFIAVYFRKNCN